MIKSMFGKKKAQKLNPDLSNLSSILSKHLKQYNFQINELNIQIDTLAKEISSMKELFVGLNSELTQKEEELKKYQRGYEKSILKKYFDNLIDLQDLVNNVIENKEDKSINNLKNYIEFLLSDLNIERFTPVLGVDFRVQEGVTAHAETIPIDEKNQNGHVAQAVKDGYKVTFDDGSVEFIQQAVAKIYKFEKEEN